MEIIWSESKNAKPANCRVWAQVEAPRILAEIQAKLKSEREAEEAKTKKEIQE